MSTTVDFHAERLSGIGSSDAPIIMGLGLRTPYQLWLEKTSQAPRPNLSDNDRVYWGIHLEDLVAKRFASEHPTFKVRRKRKMLRNKKYPFALAHLDRTVTNDTDGITVPFEIKTSQDFESWKDGMPTYYQPQVQHQLALKDAPFAYVAVLLAGHDYREYVVQRDDAYIAELMDAEAEFWANVQDGVPPPARNIEDILLRFKEGLAGSIVAPEHLVAAAARLANVRAIKSSAEAEETQLKSVIAMFMEDHNTLLDANGKPILTFNQKISRRLNQGALKAEQPDVFNLYYEETSTREIRIASDFKKALAASEAPSDLRPAA
jgi:putative phage-type endonuclease